MYVYGSCEECMGKYKCMCVNICVNYRWNGVC